MTLTIPRIESSQVQSAPTTPFLLRVGGLPLDAADRLVFGTTYPHLATLRALSASLEQQREPLVAALEQAVGEADRRSRNRLLKLKRSVFNLQPPKQKFIPQTVAPPLDALLTPWLATWQRVKQVEETVAASFESEMPLKRAKLKQLLQDVDFQKGIMLSSPKLYRAMARYMAGNNAQLNKRTRQTERSLVQYFMRMAAKTSPFSTFTPIVRGAFAPMTAPSDIAYAFPNADKRSFIRLNMAVLSRIAQLALNYMPIRKQLPIRLVQGWWREGDRVLFVRKRQALTDGGDSSPITMNFLHEDLLFLPYSEFVADVIERMDGETTRHFEELVTSLCQEVQYAGHREQIADYLHNLMRLGFLLVPKLQIDIHNRYPVTAFREQLASLALAELAPVVTALEGIEQELRRIETGTLADRENAIEQIRHLVRTAFDALNGRMFGVPATIIYEDTVVAASDMRIGKKNWDGILTDLARLQQILPAFDTNLPARLVTRGYFIARHGHGAVHDDFPSFATEFYRDFYSNYQQAAFGNNDETTDLAQRERYRNFFKQPEIDALNQAGVRCATYMNDRLATHPDPGVPLELDDTFFDTLGAIVPPPTAEVTSYAYFAQPEHSQAQPQLVINRIYTGFTLMYSRFAHFFADEERESLASELRQSLLEIQPPGAVFAEFKGGHDATNLNVHPQVTPYEIVCPGEFSKRPYNEQIPLSDLQIVHDAEQNRLLLRSRRLNCEVIPLYLGFLLPMSLPEIQQVLLQFAPASLCAVDLWRDIELPEEESVQHLPRVTYGDLILHRAEWRVSDNALPLREPGESDISYWQKLDDWREAHGIPTRVFAKQGMAPRPEENDEDDNESADETPARGEYKPFYVNFADFFSITQLETATRASQGNVTFTEMCPHRNDLWLEIDEQSYVAEMVFEVNDVRI